MRQVLCPRLIGRDAELETIVAAVEAARDGRGETIFLVGEAGIGKSRLAREAEHAAQLRGLRVLWGRSVEAGTAAAGAYRPIAEALLSGLRRDGLPADRPELRPFQPILARLIPDWREAGASPLEESLVLLGEAVLRLLRAMGAERGCLLVLEDLHWADSESMAVLEYLIANAAGERLVILVTSRPESSSAALALARSSVAHRLGTVLDLARLPEAAVHEMASACLDNTPVPEAVERLLSASADGLPLLVEDLLAEWAGAGALVFGEGGWFVRHVVGPIVPLSFGETVRRRMRLLGDEATRLLRLAALLGRHFDWLLLVPASGMDEERVLEVLHAAIDAQLLRAEVNRFGFRHALTREAVLEQLLPAERSRQAMRLLGLVEVAHPNLEDRWCELAADLAEEGGDHARAATLLLHAGRAWLKQGALATAETMLERARALAGARYDLELRAHIDDTLLHVLAEAGQHERVFEFGEELLKGTRRGPAGDVRLALIHLTIAHAAVAGSRLVEANQHLTEARHLDRDDALEARIDALAARIALDERRIDDAARFAQSALSAADRLGQTEVACEALIVIGRLARGKDLDSAENAFQDAHNLAEAHGLTVWRTRARHELGTIDMFRDASPRRLLEARALALESGALVTAAYVDGELAALYNMQFDLSRSFEAARAALQAGRRYRLAGVEAMALVFEAEVYAYRRDRTSMERCLVEMAAVAGSDQFFPSAAWECRAMRSLCEEERTRGVRELEAAIERARLLPLAAPMPAYGLWALLRGLRDDDAAGALEELRGSWAIMHPATRGLLAYAEAIHLARLGQMSESAAAVSRGDAVLQLAPWFFHMGRRILAEAAIQDGWGEPAAWLRESADFFERHGYEAIVSACRSLLRKTGAPIPVTRSHAEVPEPFRAQGVTEREMDVLAVLAEGLSNRDIGARLYLSPKTVEKHVASLMDKLEVRTRVQLAALATAKLGYRAGARWGRSTL